MKGWRIAALLTVVIIVGPYLGYHSRPFLDPPLLAIKEPEVIQKGYQGDCVQEVRSATLPFGSIVQPGATIQKVWVVINCGTTTLKGNKFIIIAWRVPSPSERQVIFGKQVSVIPELPPGKEGNLILEIKVPNVPGDYFIWYKLSTPDENYFFGDTFIVNFRVPAEQFPSS